MPKTSPPRTERLPVLLLLLCSILLASFWFFRARTAQAPSTNEEVEMVETETAGKQSTINEIDKELLMLEKSEKEL